MSRAAFTDPISGDVLEVEVGGADGTPYDGSHGVVHPPCDRLADVSPELDAFFCPRCRRSGRISGAWFIDLRRAHTAAADRSPGRWPKPPNELRQLAEAATPGPWRWSGHVDGAIELTTVRHGRQRIVTSTRAVPCVVQLADESIALTVDACADCRAQYGKPKDPFVDYRCPLARNLDTLWLRDDGIIRPANSWAVREQHYRTDVAFVDHPDAAYLAAVDPQTILALLDRLDQDVHAAGGDGGHYCEKCHEDSRAEPAGAGKTGAR